MRRPGYEAGQPAQRPQPGSSNWSIVELAGAPRRHNLEAFQHVLRAWPAGLASCPAHCGESMPKPNYHQARKQKEVARKARQQEKQQRRSARPGTPAPDAETSALQEPGGPRDAGSENPT